jgi:hypothetical protein
VSWISLDDGILEHPKFIRAVKLGGSEAIHLWLGLRAYCARHLTDGFIPEDMLDEVRGPALKARKRALDALLAVGLVDPADGGVALHDYLDWSRSRDDVVSKRDAARARQAKSRATRTGQSQASATPSQRDARASDASVTPEPASLSQRDARVTDASVTEPSPLLSSPYLTNPTKPPKPPEAGVVVAGVDEPHKLTSAFTATDEDWSAIAPAGIPDPCKPILIRWFLVHHLDGDSRTATEWRRSFRHWATKAWNTRRTECLAESKAPTQTTTGEPDWQAQKAAEKAAEAEHRARVAADEAATLARIRRIDAEKRAKAQAAS